MHRLSAAYDRSDLKAVFKRGEAETLRLGIFSQKARGSLKTDLDYFVLKLPRCNFLVKHLFLIQTFDPGPLGWNFGDIKTNASIYQSPVTETRASRKWIPDCAGDVGLSSWRLTASSPHNHTWERKITNRKLISHLGIKITPGNQK
jgi:hypothetical protein